VRTRAIAEFGPARYVGPDISRFSSHMIAFRP
jgi:hypothetical protein